MKTRKEILADARRIAAEIAQIIIDTEHWNTARRKPDEAPIDPDPDGQMAKCAMALDDMIAKEEVWHVYRMNDCDWWLARSADEAVTDFRTTFGDDETLLEMPVKRLSQVELYSTMYRLEEPLDGGEDGPIERITFRDQLDRRLTESPLHSGLFATTEF